MLYLYFGTYCPNTTISEKTIPQTLVTLALFFSQKLFVWAFLSFFLFIVAEWQKSSHSVE
jgi:hypothetical protein